MRLLHTWRIFAILGSVAVGTSACSAARYNAAESADYGQYAVGDGEGDAVQAESGPRPMAQAAYAPVSVSARPAPVRAPAMPTAEKKAHDFNSAQLGGSLGGKSGPRPPQQPANQHDLKQTPAVIYQGYLKLRVRRTLEAIDAATKAAIEGGGYVQMQTASTLIVRMPATDFDAAMLKFANLGEVLQRQIQAVDVTKQVTDLDARLAVAVQSRARLLELLKTVKDVEERLQILEEIKRLTEQIETMQSSLATLRNLTNYFTITIDFESLVNAGAVASHASPFEWIRELVAHRVTLNDGHEHVHMALPTGFVLFDEKWVLFGDSGAWRAQASDTSMLRAAAVRNDPRGDALFWARAIEFEMDGRDEALVDSSKQGKLEVRVFKNKDARPRWWLIGTTTVEDKTWVVEAFFPDETAYKAHISAVLSALTTFGAD